MHPTWEIGCTNLKQWKLGNKNFQKPYWFRGVNLDRVLAQSKFSPPRSWTVLQSPLAQCKLSPPTLGPLANPNCHLRWWRRRWTTAARSAGYRVRVAGDVHRCLLAGYQFLFSPTRACAAHRLSFCPKSGPRRRLKCTEYSTRQHKKELTMICHDTFENITA